MTIRILFICLGNICRSPSAEGVFRHLVSEAGLSDHIDTDSAGTGPWHAGNPPDRRAQDAARARGFDISHLRARQVQSDDFHAFDFLVAMDKDNHQDLISMSPQDLHHKISLLLDHSGGPRGKDVPDPYYGDLSGFHDMMDLIETGAKGLLEHIRETHLFV